MKTSHDSYKLLGIIALVTFVVLVGLQIHWLYRAADARISMVEQELALVAPDVALDVNAIDHDSFHVDKDLLGQFPDSLIENAVQNSLEEKGIEGLVAYAIYDDSLGQIVKTNKAEHGSALLKTEAKACLSCIVSFSTIGSDDANLLDSEVIDRSQVFASSTFQYYSPIVRGKEDSRQLWFSMHRPNIVAETLGSMILLFAVNLLLLVVLLGLFYYLLRSLKAYRNLTEVKEVFFNNMTHEFKTPLSSIRLASRMLQTKTPDAKSVEYLRLIDNESVALENQIDKLLELSLLDHKKIELEMQDIDLASILQSMSDNLKPLIERKSASLYIVAGNVPEIEGDPYHLSNAFSNLVENSIKYGQEGVNIGVTATAVKDGVEIVFQDDGPGIDLKHQPHIFDRFYRAQKTDQYRGAGFGIGLSYVKSIIEGHKGKVKLVNSSPEGTSFKITL